VETIKIATTIRVSAPSMLEHGPFVNHGRVAVACPGCGGEGEFAFKIKSKNSHIDSWKP